MELHVKAINRSGTVYDERNTIVPEGYDYDSLSDAAVLYCHNYKAIFGKTRAEVKANKKRLSVLMIQLDRKKIYRRYFSDNNISGIDAKTVGLTPASIRELSSGRNNEVVGMSVKVRKACSFCYYWNHPFHATRISYRLGLPSLIIGVFALVLSVLSLF